MTKSTAEFGFLSLDEIKAYSYYFIPAIVFVLMAKKLVDIAYANQSKQTAVSIRESAHPLQRPYASTAEDILDTYPTLPESVTRADTAMSFLEIYDTLEPVDNIHMNERVENPDLSLVLRREEEVSSTLSTEDDEESQSPALELKVEDNALLNLSTETAAEVLRPTLDNVKSEPRHSRQKSWDASFTIACLSSSSAYKIYGAGFFIAALALTGAISMGIIPVVLGGTAASLSLLAGSSCFFKAAYSSKTPASDNNACLKPEFNAAN